MRFLLGLPRSGIFCHRAPQRVEAVALHTGTLELRDACSFSLRIFSSQSQRYLSRAAARSTSCNRYLSCRRIHTTDTFSKEKKVISSEPIKFTTSAANVRSMPEYADRNEYQPIIVAISLIVFFVYFLYLREENDLDKALNVSLFDSVPAIEEPHLAQAIPRMKEVGVDTTEAELRLKYLVEKRLAKEELAKK